MYDYDIFPLGHLSLNQINKGENILNILENIIMFSSNNSEKILNLSNDFYTNIPHITEKLKIIDNIEILNDKKKLLNYMKTL